MAKPLPATQPTPAWSRPDPRDRTTPGWYWLYGLHAVEAALLNPRRSRGDLLLSRNAARRLGPVLEAVGRQPRICNQAKFTAVLGDAIHQGAALHVQQLTPPRLAELASDRNQPILVLDQVTDPRNVGAIVRSAAAFGAAAIVTSWRHAPPETAVMAKTASGGLERVPYLRVRNLARSLAVLQDQGRVVLGLDSAAAQDLVSVVDVQHTRSLALVLGSEGRGLRQGTRTACDHLVAIRHGGPIASLNISNAAAIALFVLARSMDAVTPRSPHKQ